MSPDNTNILHRHRPLLRDSNLELLRIVAMILIIAHHYVVNSGISESMNAPENFLSLKTLFLNFFGMFGRMGTNCFVLISGYFMCTKSVTLRKFLKLVLEVEFYNVLFFVVFTLSGYQSFSLKAFLTALIPIRFLNNNFVGCYLVLFCLMPFLNILIRNLEKKMHARLVLLLLSVYSLLASIPFFEITSNDSVWFSILYLTASYIRKHGFLPKYTFSRWVVLSFVFLLLSVCSVVFFIFYFAKTGDYYSPYYLLADSNKLLAFLFALSLFMMFKSVKIKNSRAINTVAGCTFGVLLIHCNCPSMNVFLWQDMLHCKQIYQSDFLVLHAFLSCLGVFLACTILDYTRKQVIEKPFFSILDRFYADKNPC